MVKGDQKHGREIKRVRKKDWDGDKDKDKEREWSEVSLREAFWN